MGGWIVVQSQPGKQKIAAESARAAGAEIFLPVYRIVSLTDGRKQEREGYLFGTYMFARQGADWMFLNSTRGIAKVLMSGDMPGRVPDAVIDRLRQREDRKGFIRLPITPQFMLGQKVKLERGAFAGQTGVYDGADSLEREAVLLDVLGRMTRVSVSVGSIAAA